MTTLHPPTNGHVYFGDANVSLKAMMKKDSEQQTNGNGRSRSRPAYGPTATQEELLATYSFPDKKLKHTLDDSSKIPLVLVACGSFNPISILHLRLFEMAADFVRRNTNFELVGQYMSPVGDAYKKPGLVNAAHRITMCRLGTTEQDRIMVDPWEAYHSQYKPTAQVLKHFDDELNVKRNGIATKEGDRKKCRVALLAGADLMETMSTPGLWSEEDLDIILGQYGVYVVERSGTDAEEALSNLAKWRDNIVVIEQLVKNDVSSTIIRNFLRKDLSVRYLTPGDVLDYIDEHGLYNEDGIRPHSRSRSAELHSD